MLNRFPGSSAGFSGFSHMEEMRRCSGAGAAEARGGNEEGRAVRALEPTWGGLIAVKEVRLKTLHERRAIQANRVLPDLVLQLGRERAKAEGLVSRRHSGGERGTCKGSRVVGKRPAQADVESCRSVSEVGRRQQSICILSVCRCWWRREAAVRRWWSTILILLDGESSTDVPLIASMRTLPFFLGSSLFLRSS